MKWPKEHEGYKSMSLLMRKIKKSPFGIWQAKKSTMLFMTP